MLLCRSDEFGVRAKNKIIFVQFSCFVTIKFGKHFLVLLGGFFPLFFIYYFCKFKRMVICPFDPTGM